MRRGARSGRPFFRIRGLVLGVHFDEGHVEQTFCVVVANGTEVVRADVESRPRDIRSSPFHRERRRPAPRTPSGIRYLPPLGHPTCGCCIGRFDLASPIRGRTGCRCRRSGDRSSMSSSVPAAVDEATSCPSLYRYKSMSMPPSGGVRSSVLRAILKKTAPLSVISCASGPRRVVRLEDLIWIRINRACDRHIGR